MAGERWTADYDLEMLEDRRKTVLALYTVAVTGTAAFSQSMNAPGPPIDAVRFPGDLSSKYVVTGGGSAIVTAPVVFTSVIAGTTSRR